MRSTCSLLFAVLLGAVSCADGGPGGRPRDTVGDAAGDITAAGPAVRIAPGGAVTLVAGSVIRLEAVVVDPGDRVASCAWDLGGAVAESPGDGRVLEGVRLDAAGVYTVTVAVLDADGARLATAASVSLTVLEPLPATAEERLSYLLHRLDADGDGVVDEGVEGRLLSPGAPRWFELDGDGRLLLDVWLSAELPDDLDVQLDALGATVGMRSPTHLFDAWVPLASVRLLATLPDVARVALPLYPVHGGGSLTSQGDAVLRTDEVRARFGVDGSGVRVAVMSDGLAGLAAAQASGDLPDVRSRSFRADGSIESGAEGTAMLEIVHDIAPGADLHFANSGTFYRFVEAARFLARPDDPATAEEEGWGMDVIIDDLGYFRGPYDGTSEVSRAVSEAVTEHGRRYFTISHNFAERHWMGALDPDVEGWHQFDTSTFPGAGPRDFVFEVLPGGSFFIMSSWQEPDFHDAQTDLQLAIWRYDFERGTFDYHSMGGLVDDDGLHTEIGVGVQRPEFYSGVPDGRRDAIATEFARVVDETGEGMVLSLRVLHVGGPIPPRLDVFFVDSGVVLEAPVAEGSVPNIGDAEAVVSVGTVPWYAPTERAAYSGYGPTWDGRAKPEVVGVDAVCVTGVEGFGDDPARHPAVECDGNVFFGTSAASPHVGAVAALLLQAEPSLTHAQIQGILQRTAVDIGEPGRDAKTGYGRVDAFAALAEVAEPTAPPDPPTVAIETIHFDGTLRGGEVVQIQWHTTGAVRAALAADIEPAADDPRGAAPWNVTVPGGKMFVRPSETITYTLTAYGPEDVEASASVTIPVAADGGGAFEVVDRVYGVSEAVLEDSGRLFVGEGTQVGIFTAGEVPSHLGSVGVTGSVSALAVDGDTLYIADTNGLHLVDVSDPTASVRVGALYGMAFRAMVHAPCGLIASVDGAAGLHLVDVADPESPTVQAFLPGVDGATDMTFDGRYLYLVANYGGGNFQVVDLAASAAPVVIGTAATDPLGQGGLAVADGRAFVGAGSPGVVVLDVSEPSAPAQSAVLELSGRVSDVAVSGGALFVAKSSGACEIVPIGSDAGVTLDLPGLGALAVAAAGGVGWFAGEHGMHAVGVEGGSYVRTGGYPGRIEGGLAATSGRLLLADDAAGLLLADFDDPAGACHVGMCAGTEDAPLRPGAVVARGEYAFVSDKGDFATIDLSDPVRPRRCSPLEPVIPVRSEIVLTRNLALCFGLNAGMSGSRFQVIDVSRPCAPELIGSTVVSPVAATGIAAEGWRAYVGFTAGGARGSGVKLIDISDPTAPEVAAELFGMEDYGFVEALAAQGPYLFAAMKSAATGGEGEVLVFHGGGAPAPIVHRYAPDPAYYGTQGSGYVDDLVVWGGSVGAIFGATDGRNELHWFGWREGASGASLWESGGRMRGLVMDDGRLFVDAERLGVVEVRPPSAYAVADIELPSAGAVTARLVSVHAKLVNDARLVRPRGQALWTATESSVGALADLGHFEAGAVLGFAIDTGDGHTFDTDPRANPDGLPFAYLVEVDDATWQLWFEDRARDSDRDFNDMVIEVHLEADGGGF